MEKFNLPIEILKHKEDIALFIFKSDFLTNPSLIRYKEKYIQDTIYTLRYLGTSLEVNESRIFVNYMQWFGSLAHYLHFNIESMKRHFIQCESVFEELLNHTLADSCMKTFKMGKETFENSFFSTHHSNVYYDAFINHMIAMHSDLAYQHVLDLIDKGMTIQEIYLKVLQPTLYKVGELWHQGIISVAKEHYITAAIQHIIGKLYSMVFTNKEKSQKTVTAVCAGDEMHEIGMRMVADFFELSGWDSVFLGSNIPVNVVINHLIENPTRLLAISATTSSHLIEVRDLIVTIKSNPKLNRIKIMVGGRVFNETPNLWKSLGADGYALDAEQAVILGTVLVGESNE